MQPIWIRQIFEAQLPHVGINFDQPDFAATLGANAFDLVTALEVIEHVESPIGFLRHIRRRLSPTGVAVIATPNVDCLPAGIKQLTQRFGQMDNYGDPTPSSPIFYDLRTRQFLPRAGLHLQEHYVFPSHGFQLSQKPLAWARSVAVRFLPGKSIPGDQKVLVVKPP